MIFENEISMLQVKREFGQGKRQTEVHTLGVCFE